MHINLGKTLDRMGRYREALGHAEQALDLFEAAGNLPGQARALNNVGWYHALLGDHQQALTRSRQALGLQRGLGDRCGEANTWDTLGYSHHQLGHHAKAVSCYQQAIGMFCRPRRAQRHGRGAHPPRRHAPRHRPHPGRDHDLAAGPGASWMTCTTPTPTRSAPSWTGPPRSPRPGSSGAPGRAPFRRPAAICSDGPMVITRHGGRWTLEDRFGSCWQYLPVQVPDGCCALRAELEYDRPGAVLDLGCIGPAGFRGWSGGARRSFVITPGAATPGYLPGELEPGTWHVVIGLHRVPPAGAEYRLTAEVSSTPGELAPAPPPDPLPPLADRPPRRDLPASPGRRWLAGDLHTHTVHSDGAMTVPELARFAVGQGLDFIAVTDHNTVSHHAELPAAAAAHGITLLPGQEVTVQAGHANVLGDVGWIDFREPADSWLEAAERGGRADVGQPPHRRRRELDHPDDPAPAAGRDLALELARHALDDAVRLVAGLGSRPPSRWAAATGTGPGPTRRRARRPPGSSARTTRPRRCWTGCAPGGPRSPPAGTGRCCSGSTASWSRPGPTAPS